MADNEKLKMAVIAGAAYATKFKEQNPNATESDILKSVTKEIKNILSKLEENF